MILHTENDLKKATLEIKSVAVIGMQSEKKSDRPAYQIPKIAFEHGIEVIPVNPQIETSLGQKSYPSIALVGKKVDMINVFRRSEQIPEIAQEILSLPKTQYPKYVWLQTGISHDDAAKKLSDAGIDVIQDACLGVYVSRYRR